MLPKFFLKVKTEKEFQPETKKQKPAGLDPVDPNEQRRMVTEQVHNTVYSFKALALYKFYVITCSLLQLKSLFREREQRGERLVLYYKLFLNL